MARRNLKAIRVDRDEERAKFTEMLAGATPERIMLVEAASNRLRRNWTPMDADELRALEAQIARRLPDNLPASARAIAAIAATVAELLRERPAEPVALGTDVATAQVAAHLAGQTIALPGALVAFGSQSQTGDVQTGDVAGRDIVKVSVQIVAPTAAAQPAATVARPRATRGGDIFARYEAGVERLLAAASAGSEQHVALLSYQQRLRENLRSSRLFGDGSARSAERAELIYELNLLALELLQRSFNDLVDE